jgi:hypothetical protein
MPIGPFAGEFDGLSKILPYHAPNRQQLNRSDRLLPMEIDQMVLSASSSIFLKLIIDNPNLIRYWIRVNFIDI